MCISDTLDNGLCERHVGPAALAANWLGLVLRLRRLGTKVYTALSSFHGSALSQPAHNETHDNAFHAYKLRLCCWVISTLHSSIPFIKLACQCKCGEPFSDSNLEARHLPNNRHRFLWTAHEQTTTCVHKLDWILSLPLSNLPHACRTLTASAAFAEVHHTIQPIFVLKVLSACSWTSLRQVLYYICACM